MTDVLPSNLIVYSLESPVTPETGLLHICD